MQLGLSLGGVGGCVCVFPEVLAILNKVISTLSKSLPAISQHLRYTAAVIIETTKCLYL